MTNEPHSSHPTRRTPTHIDAIAERWVDSVVALDPVVGTYIGRNQANGEYGDYSPDGHATSLTAVKKTLAELGAAAASDNVDIVTLTDLSSELRLIVEASEAGLQLRDLNVISSPSQEIREIYDLMPTSTVEDWESIAERLSNVPQAISGYIETLKEGIRQGITPARRQVSEVFTQIQKNSTNDGFFWNFAQSASVETGALPEALVKNLANGAQLASQAYGNLSTFFADELMPVASKNDAIGRELYALHSRKFLGTTIDLDETYEWGVEELARMVAEQEAVAKEILPGASVAEAIAHLDSDPQRKLHGVQALQEWMQEASDRAIDELSGSHFDIPQEIRRLECMIAPVAGSGIYYAPPTDDFSRPGRMWWSIPEGVTEFDTWRELTTVYHEGVPGHHLQLGQAVYNRAQLNTWRRQLAGTSGHEEGWALYAERLMHELGYLDDPADKLGMLDGQRMRAARVVLDLGVHLGKPRLDGNGIWDADYALEFMRQNVNMNDAFIRFEVNRYLGRPGQAPSYKIGQRIWESLRDEYRQREGTNFSAKEFHRKALDLGGVRLDTLQHALLSP